MLPTLLVLAILALSVIAAWTVQRTQTESLWHQRTALRRVAESRQGHVHRSRSAIRFDHGSTFVWIDFHDTGNRSFAKGKLGRHQSAFTRAHIAWPDRMLRMEVYPEGILDQIRKLMGMEDIEIGNARFDRDYLIQGNRRPEIVQLLSPTVVKWIDQLRGMPPSQDIYVAIGNGTLLIKKRGILSDHDQLQSFTQMCLNLYDSANTIETAGIEFVERPPSPIADADGAACQVCGDEIKVELVFCKSCRTPHHEDCWQYFGTCSTYGCGQTTYLRPKRKKSTKKPPS